MLDEIVPLVEQMESSAEEVLRAEPDEAIESAQEAQQLSRQVLSRIWKRTTEVKSLTVKAVKDKAQGDLVALRARVLKAAVRVREAKAKAAASGGAASSSGPKPPATPPPKAAAKAPVVAGKPGLRISSGAVSAAGKGLAGKVVGIKPQAKASVSGKGAAQAMEDDEAPEEGDGGSPAKLRRYSVYDEGGKPDKDGVVKLLTGDFVHKGTNHGRPAFQKSADGESPDIFLFYWDARDGAEHEGWYFSDAIGNVESWAFVRTKTALPPKKGWRIPTDGPVRNTFNVACQDAGAQPAAASKLLKAGPVALTPANIAEALANASPEDKALWNETVDEATREATSAEIVVDKIARACDDALDAEESGGEDADAARQRAIEEASALHESAAVKLKETFALITKKLAASRAFANGFMRAKATKDLGMLRVSLTKANERLKGFADIEGHLKQRAAVKQQISDARARFATIEGEVARAAEVCQPISAGVGEPPSAELMQSATAAIEAASSKLLPAMRTMKSKLAVAKGPLKDELALLMKRAQEAEEQLNGLRASHRRVQEKSLAATAISDVAEQVRSFQEAVQKAEVAMAPFVTGVEALSPGEVRQAAEAGDEAMKLAAQVAGQARLIVSKRWAEVQRMQEDSSREVKDRVKKSHEELQALIKRLSDLRITTKGKKEEALKAEPMVRVGAVETLVAKIAEKGELISDESKLAVLKPAEIREAAVAVRSSQTELFTEMQAAQKLLVARQIDAKRRNAQTELTDLARLQERLRAVQTQANKFRTLPPAVERHIAAQKHIDEAVGKVEAAEGSLEKALAMIAMLSEPGEALAEGDEGAPEAPATVEDADAAANEASVALAGVFRFLAGSAKARGVPEDEVERLQARIKEAQERLKQGRPALAVASEKKRAEALLAEADVAAKTAEAAVEKATDLASAVLDSKGELGTDKEHFVVAFKEAARAAQLALKTASGAIEEKRTAAKGFSEAVAESALKELAAMKEFVDLLGTDMADVHKDASDQIYGTARRDIEARLKVAEVKAKTVVQVCEEISSRSTEGKEIDAGEMTDLLEKGGQASEEAASLITEMISTLQGHLRDLEASETPAKKDFKQNLTKLVQMEGANNKQKKELMSIEQRFVAKHVLKLAEPMVQDLEAKLEHLTSVSAPLVVESEKVTFNATMLLARAAEALRAHAAAKELTPQAVCDEIIGSEDAIVESKFVSFIHSLPQKEQEDLPLSEAQLKAAYTALDSVGAGRVAAGDFLELMRRRYIVLAEAPLLASPEAEGEVTRTLAPLEMVEAIGPNGESSATVAKVRAELDKAEGFAAIGDASLFEPFSPYSACAHKTNRALEEVAAAVKKATAFMQEKGAEFKAISSVGKAQAVREAEDGLMRLRARAARVQAAHATLKKKVGDELAERAKKMKLEAHRRDQAAKTAAAAAAAKDAGSLVSSVTAIADRAAGLAGGALKAAAGAEDGARLEAGLLEQMDAASEELQAALREAAASSASLAERTAAVGANPGLKKLLQASASKISSLEARCRQQAKALDNTRLKLARVAERGLHEAVKAHMRSSGSSAQAVFDKLATGGAAAPKTIPVDAFRSFVQEQVGAELQPSQLELGLRRYAQGVSRLAFSGMAQDYRAVVKPIVLTSTLAVQEAEIIRKLELGEVVEVLGDITTDPQVGLERARGRAMRDNGEGWITLRGNQGTPFFDVAGKPYLLCKAPEVPMRNECSRSAVAARALRGGDALEVLEGPVREPAVEVMRVRGRAKKDGRTGWVTMRDGAGAAPSLELAEALVCRCSIALTKDADAGAVVRKLELGELLDRTGEPQEDPERNVTRVPARARSDGKEGWVTMRGSDGTQYVVDNTMIYTCAFDVPMESSFPSGSSRMRTLEQGEVFDVLEGPTVEKKVGELFARCRGLRDGAEGWVCVDSSVERWAPRCTCRKKGDLQEDVDCADGVGVVRSLEAFEPLEVLSPPARSSSGAVRVHVRAERDGATGWTTLRQPGSDEALLECLFDVP